jgi:hypothetical protein
VTVFGNSSLVILQSNSLLSVVVWDVGIFVSSLVCRFSLMGLSDSGLLCVFLSEGFLAACLLRECVHLGYIVCGRFFASGARCLCR